MWLLSTVVGRLWHGAHIFWSKQGGKQTMLCQCLDIYGADDVLEMDCLSESSADGCLPIWWVSHVLWRPRINYRCVSPLSARLLACPNAELKVYVLQRAQRVFRILDSSLTPNILQSLVGVAAGLINTDQFFVSQWRGLWGPDWCFSNWQSTESGEN